MVTATPLLSRPGVERVIERVGTCADGCCARFRCRTCGNYWLGDEAEHACGSAVPGLEQRIKAWMGAELEKGEGLTTCTRRVLEQVKAAGLEDALLEWAIRELWRNHDDHGGDRAQGNANGVVNTDGSTHGRGLCGQLVSRNIRIEVAMGARQLSSQQHQVATTAGNGVAVRRAHQKVTPGPRRVNVQQLGTDDALLESLFKVDGAWVRLGDLSKAQCKFLQREYAAAAERSMRKARAFSLLFAGLGEGQTVRQRWTAEQVADLVGDTVRGAAPA